MKHIIKLSQVFIALTDSPALLRIFGNTYQVVFGRVGEGEMRQYLVDVAVQFVNKPCKRVV